MNSRKRTLLMLSASVVLVLQTGCLTPFDVQSVAQGQFISFINALINTVTSDAIRGALSG